MTEILSLWRAPLDRVALSSAVAIAERQPRCSIGYGEDFSAMTIYNYGFFIDSIVDPTGALGGMFAAMNPGPYATGGRAFIPQQSFAVNATSSGLTVPDQCVIDGSGAGGILVSEGGSSFYHFVVTPVGPGASTFLTSTTSDFYTFGGIYFQSLAFQWGTSSNAKDTCIYAGVLNVRAINCTFTDCPRAFNAQSLSGTLEQCTINYTVSAPNSTKAVVLGGPQCGVIGPGQFSQTSPGSGGATGCTCISIEEAEHPVVSGIQIVDWTIGIDLSQMQNTRFAQITDCEIECWQTAVNIQIPATASKTTAGIEVAGCALAKASDSDDGNPIVVISANGLSNTLLNDIGLIDCTVFNMAADAPLSQHGLEIASGSNIRIIGGTYSNNSSNGGAGIAITGSPSGVKIIGANLQPSYAASPNVRNQQYGLLISGSPTYVRVASCDMTGYTLTGQRAVDVTGTPIDLLIQGCPGYNDQNTLLNGSVAPTSNINAATCTTPYFGPSVIVYSGSVPVVLHVFGETITSSFGVVFLPSPYDSFYFSAAPTTFSWVGK